MKVTTVQLARRMLPSRFGLPASTELTDDELLAAAIRRAAGFLCPCSRRRILQSVTESLMALTDDPEELHDAVVSALDNVIAFGDLVEVSAARPDDGDQSLLIHMAPPAFVLRSNGDTFILGVVPDSATILPETISALIRHEGFARRIPAGAIDDPSDYFNDLGFVEIPLNLWLRVPPSETAEVHLNRHKRILAAQATVHEIPGLILLDTTCSVSNYRQRWTALPVYDGFYVARRSQAYGADLWCFVQIKNGRPCKFVDLPLVGVDHRGCDAGWLLQCAIDYLHGSPQVATISRTADGEPLMSLDGPVPSWIHRRLEYLGRRHKVSKALIGYRISQNAIEEEARFIADHLWMSIRRLNER